MANNVTINTSQNTQSKRLLKRVCKTTALLLGILFIFVIIALFFCILVRSGSEPWSECFFLGRNADVWTVPVHSDEAIRLCTVSSLDNTRGITRHKPPVVSETLTIQTKLKYDNGYAIVVIDKDTQKQLSAVPVDATVAIRTTHPADKVLSSSVVDTTKDTSSSFIMSVSESQMLFGTVSSVSMKCNHSWQHLFWLVPSKNGEWLKNPIEFDCCDDAVMHGWETLSKYSWIIFLLHSEKQSRNYMVIYDYKQCKSVKTEELPVEFNNWSVNFRVLSGEKSILLYNTSKPFRGLFLSVADLAVLKTVTFNNVHLLRNTKLDAITASPDFRYIAFAGLAVVVLDTNSNCVYTLEDYSGVLSLLRQKCYFPSGWLPQLRSSMSFYSIAFFEDSNTLYGANLSGELFQWDTRTKKRVRKISSTK